MIIHTVPLLRNYLIHTISRQLNHSGRSVKNKTNQLVSCFRLKLGKICFGSDPGITHPTQGSNAVVITSKRIFQTMPASAYPAEDRLLPSATGPPSAARPCHGHPRQQISRGWAAAQIGPSIFQRMGRGPTQPIKFSIFHVPARPINFSKVSSRPGPTHHIFKSLGPARPGPARHSFQIGPARPRQTAHNKP